MNSVWKPCAFIESGTVNNHSKINAILENADRSNNENTWFVKHEGCIISAKTLLEKEAERVTQLMSPGLIGVTSMQWSTGKRWLLDFRSHFFPRAAITRVESHVIIN